MATTFVSPDGDNSYDCSSPYIVDSTHGPCRTFDGALTNASEGGTVACVDAGAYGDVIHPTTKSVTIDCSHGAGALDAVAIVINAPGKTIRLRNLTLNGRAAFPGTSPSTPMVDITAADDVELENVVVTYGNGNPLIKDHRAGPGKLSIRNSVVTDNNGPGIVVVPQGGSTINVVLENVSANNTTYGLAVGAGARVMMTNSNFSQNAIAGIESDGGGIVEINNTTIANNATGIIASAGASISISKNTISSNNVGVSGTTQSFGNNRFLRSAVSDGTTPSPFGGSSTEDGLR